MLMQNFGGKKEFGKLKMAYLQKNLVVTKNFSLKVNKDLLPTFFEVTTP